MDNHSAKNKETNLKFPSIQSKNSDKNDQIKLNAKIRAKAKSQLRHKTIDKASSIQLKYENIQNRSNLKKRLGRKKRKNNRNSSQLEKISSQNAIEKEENKL
mmetsp:Transcript_6766/g.5909  ORF Transcript_6766/g.5909 Transcript_6766/m.5909 type:complete len:102 (+) Transcript_6766:682-987(+)